MSDVMKVEILEDGTVSVTTDAVSGTNHVSADELLEALSKELGGKRTTKARKKTAHTHRHHHKHVKA